MAQDPGPCPAPPSRGWGSRAGSTCLGIPLSRLLPAPSPSSLLARGEDEPPLCLCVQPRAPGAADLLCMQRQDSEKTPRSPQVHALAPPTLQCGLQPPPQGVRPVTAHPWDRPSSKWPAGGPLPPSPCPGAAGTLPRAKLVPASDPQDRKAPGAATCGLVSTPKATPRVPGPHKAMSPDTPTWSPHPVHTCTPHTCNASPACTPGPALPSAAS